MFRLQTGSVLRFTRRMASKYALNVPGFFFDKVFLTCLMWCISAGAPHITQTHSTMCLFAILKLFNSSWCTSLTAVTSILSKRCFLKLRPWYSPKRATVFPCWFWNVRFFPYFLNILGVLLLVLWAIVIATQNFP